MSRQDELDGAINEILKSVKHMITASYKQSTQVYEGIIISNNNDGRWNIQYNGETHPIKPYGSIVPSVGLNVKVIIPQGNQAIAFFI